MECSADSQKVMQCLKAGGVGGGGGGSSVKPWTIQDLSLPNMPSVLSQSIRLQDMWICCFLRGVLSHQQSSFSQDRGHFIIPIICSLVSEVVDYFTFGEGTQSDTACVGANC